MIAYETHKTRRFFGCLQAGGDVLDELRSICRSQRITTGRIVASGYLQSALFQIYDPEKRESEPERQPEQGPFVLLSLTGTISQGSTGTELSVFAHVAATMNPGSTRGGALLSGENLYVEYEIRAVDDIDFVRETDPKTGLSTWLNIRNPGAARDLSLPIPSDLPTESLDSADELDSEEEWEEVVLETGDILDHAKLGTCLVVDEPDGDRVSVQLSTGRVVELHLGMVELTMASNSKPRRYAVRVRRR